MHGRSKSSRQDLFQDAYRQACMGHNVTPLEELGAGWLRNDMLVELDYLSVENAAALVAGLNRCRPLGLKRLRVCRTAKRNPAPPRNTSMPRHRPHPLDQKHVDKVLGALAQHTHLIDLQELHLTDVTLTRASIPFLTVGLASSIKLTRLAIPGSRIGDAMFRELVVVLGKLPAVNSIDVSRCALTNKSGAMLKRLVMDNLTDNVNHKFGASLRSQSPVDVPATGLQHINASENRFGDETCVALAHALHNDSAVETLNLSHNSITEEGAATLNRLIHFNSTLSMVDISGNAGVERFVAGKNSPTKKRQGSQDPNRSYFVSCCPGSCIYVSRAVNQHMMDNSAHRSPRHRHDTPVATGGEEEEEEEDADPLQMFKYTIRTTDPACAYLNLRTALQYIQYHESEVGMHSAATAALGFSVLVPFFQQLIDEDHEEMTWRDLTARYRAQQPPRVHSKTKKNTLLTVLSRLSKAPPAKFNGFMRVCKVVSHHNNTTTQRLQEAPDVIEPHHMNRLLDQVNELSPPRESASPAPTVCILQKERITMLNTTLQWCNGPDPRDPYSVPAGEYRSHSQPLTHSHSVAPQHPPPLGNLQGHRQGFSPHLANPHAFYPTAEQHPQQQQQQQQHQQHQQQQHQQQQHQHVHQHHQHHHHHHQYPQGYGYPVLPTHQQQQLIDEQERHMLPAQQHTDARLPSAETERTERMSHGSPAQSSLTRLFDQAGNGEDKQVSKIVEALERITRLTERDAPSNIEVCCLLLPSSFPLPPSPPPHRKSLKACWCRRG